ncbi:carboxypeptidase regulatory-like domain-containing protein [Plantactinospora sp. B24E8]
MALIAGALFALPATPALAADPTVTITGVNASLNAGATTTLNFTVRNNNNGPILPGTSFDITVGSTFGELQCVNNCDFTDTIGPGETKSFSATLKAGNVAPGQERSGAVQITAEVGDDSASASRNIRVRGPEVQQTPTVAVVSGKVTNQASGDAVANARVTLRDSEGHSYNTSTNGSGAFQFTGTQDRPIAPGSIQLQATKDGVSESVSVNAANGQRVTGRGIALALAANEPTPSATPTEEAEEDPALEDDEATDEPTDAAAEGDDTNNASNEDSGGGSGMLLILAGGLLVALGVGAIVLLLMRRRDNGDDDEDDDDEDGPRTPAGGGRGYRGGDEPTRVANRAGSASDATMVTRPSLADAPTMMHNAPLVDEFPDPYGAPLPNPQSGPPGGGYGAGPAQQGWGDEGGYGAGPGAGGYGNAPGSGAGGYGAAPASGPGYGNAPASGPGYGNAPASGAGYGNAPASGAGGYGAPVSGAGYPNGAAAGGYGDRFDEPTGRYTGRDDDYGQPSDPYDPNAGYGPSSGAGGGYDATQRYGQDDGYADGGAYGAARGGYDQPSAGGGYNRADDDNGYGNGYQDQAGGYDATQRYGQDDGYDQPSTGGGYDQRGRGGYDDQSGYDDRAGYDQQQGGGYYDDAPRAGGGGHSRSAAPQQGGRGERRSLDWLDD